MTDQMLLSISDPVFAPYIEVTWNTASSQAVGVNVTTGSGTTHYDSPTTITDNNWHSFAVALDLDSGGGVLYVDGRTAVSFPIDASTWPVTGGAWRLGAKTDGTEFFQGNLDEVVVADSAFDESSAYQATTHATQGTTLTVLGPGSSFVYRPLATITPVATMIAQRRLPGIPIASSSVPGEETAIVFGARAHLKVDIPVAPLSTPFNWFVTVAAEGFVDDTTLSVQPLTTAIPKMSTVFFAFGAQVTVINAANVRDTVLNILPLQYPLDVDMDGTGINPKAYYVKTTANAFTSGTSISIEANPQFMPANTTLKFLSTPADIVELATDAAFGATTLDVFAIPDDIPAGTPGSGGGFPLSLSRLDARTLGPGVGNPPPPGPQPSAIMPIRRVSFRYPPPIIDSDGFPTPPP